MTVYVTKYYKFNFSRSSKYITNYQVFRNITILGKQ